MYFHNYIFLHAFAEVEFLILLLIESKIRKHFKRNHYKAT